MLNELNHMKTEFLQNISHELKTPLTNMCNYALDTLRELQREQLNVPEMEFDQNRIRAEGERLKRMVTQLLDVTAIDGGRLKISREPMSLAALLYRVADANIDMLGENGNRAALEIPDGLPDVAADMDAIEQVVLNLISNATRHTRQGEITISLTAGDSSKRERISSITPFRWCAPIRQPRPPKWTLVMVRRLPRRLATSAISRRTASK